MSDSRAVGDLYQDIWNAVFDVRNLCRFDSGRMCHYRVLRVNEIIADEHGYQFCLAQYAKPEVSLDRWLGADAAELLWDAAFKLRRRLDGSHRGWAPAVDPEVGYLLVGTGYVLVRDG